MKNNIRLIAMLLLTGLALAGLSHVKKTSAAYNVSFANFWIGKITPGSGSVGVDIWWNSGNGDYLPCQHSNDVYYDACQFSNLGPVSYYKYLDFTPTSTTFPYGIFIDNQNVDSCTNQSWCRDPGGGDTINHGWARLISDGALEIYSTTPTTVGGLRLQASFFNFANGGRYSPYLGDVALPQIGENNVGRLNGFTTSNGVKASNNRVLFELFQEQSTRTTSSGYPTTGFTSVRNNSDGYYSSGPVPSGTYQIFITDTQTNHKIILRGVSIRVPYERLDFKLDQHCFGYPTNCTDPAP